MSYDRGSLTIKEVAEKWGVMHRRVQTLCSQGENKGTTRFGNVWTIPNNTVKLMINGLQLGNIRIGEK